MFIMDNELKLNEWQFAQRKYLPFEEKLILSRRRIEDWYDFHEGDVYVSFSGGMDSTVLVDLVRKTVGDVPLVFVNTGLEYPEIVRFVSLYDNVTVLRPKMSFKEVLEVHGYPLISKETAAKIRKLRHGNLSARYRNYLLNGDERGSFGKLAEKWKFLVNAPFDISELCCDITKKQPIYAYNKETGRVPYIGITQDEGYRRQREYNRTGCNVYDAKHPKSQPLGFWTRQDILRYIAVNNLNICSIYGTIECRNGVFQNTGVYRSGCVYCCMGVQLEPHPNRFERMKSDDYRLYNYCMRPLYENGLGFDYVLNYCGFAH
ncbi:phosphoadenosine phosphosulfate reductase family protein (plasmid) [Lachnospiraceae bacterium WCA-9-b2]|uniref:Phosphoadenosine phosphosulfate reductase family protein n=1 Tax=Sporofaciens musculi TaxID=2681861 RepID=A0A7X3MMF5_9FIRM|nr:phosphoadenosine phosphosulfate reductase family protein [Sporofaciens musculi]MXP79035.1 phosphoadenosine phosphosulfate reductase family protein [Sporofaciens musculi]